MTLDFVSADGSEFATFRRNDTVDTAPETLEAARTRGDAKAVRELEENLEGRRSFLDMARKASADYR